MSVDKYKSIAVFDIDGCISDDFWRREMIPAGASKYSDYVAYHAACATDSPLEPGARILRNHIEHGDFIVFCTARPMAVAMQTSAWIEANFGIQANEGFIILMRRDEDERSAVEVKRGLMALLDQYCGETGRKVFNLYDDRMDVLQMYMEVFANTPALVSRLDVNGLVQLRQTELTANEANSPAQLFEQPLTPTNIEGAEKEIERVTHPVGFKQHPVGVQPPFMNCSFDPSMITNLHVSTGQNENRQPTADPANAAEVLFNAALLFEQRNAVYRDNAVVVGRVMSALFPDGLSLETEDDHRFYHLFELMIVKLTRFTQSDLTHRDSLEDLIVYGAMLVPLIEAHGITINREDY